MKGRRKKRGQDCLYCACQSVFSVNPSFIHSFHHHHHHYYSQGKRASLHWMLYLKRLRGQRRWRGRRRSMSIWDGHWKCRRLQGNTWPGEHACVCTHMRVRACVKWKRTGKALSGNIISILSFPPCPISCSLSPLLPDPFSHALASLQALLSTNYATVHSLLLTT